MGNVVFGADQPDVEDDILHQILWGDNSAKAFGVCDNVLRVSVINVKRPSVLHVRPSRESQAMVKSNKKAEAVEVDIKIPIPSHWTQPEIDMFIQLFDGEFIGYETNEFVDDRSVKLIFKKNRHGPNTVVPPIGKVDPQVRVDNYIDMR